LDDRDQWPVRRSDLRDKNPTPHELADVGVELVNLRLPARLLTGSARGSAVESCFFQAYVCFGEADASLAARQPSPRSVTPQALPSASTRLKRQLVFLLIRLLLLAI
jgi:hypothetical protein